MIEKRKETMRQFCVSNNLFFSELEEKEHVVVDQTFKAELMFIYFLLHKDIIRELNPKASILEMIETSDFYLDEDRVIFKENAYTLCKIFSYLKKLNEYIKNKQQLDLEYPFSNVVKRYNEKNINFTSITQEFGYSVNPYVVSKEQKDSLSKNQIKYFQKQKEYNRKRLARLILIILQGDTSYTFTLNEVMELYALVNLYPIACYDKKEEFHKKKDLNIDSSPFYKKYLCYSDQEIKNLENKIRTLNVCVEREKSLIQWLKNAIQSNESYCNKEEKFTYNKKQVKKLHQKEKKLETMNLEILASEKQKEEIQNRPDICHSILLNTVWNSMINGTYDKMNNRKEPKIIFYNIEGKKVINCVENSLERIKELLDNEELLNQLEEHPLKKKVEENK